MLTIEKIKITTEIIDEKNKIDHQSIRSLQYFSFSTTIEKCCLKE